MLRTQKEEARLTKSRVIADRLFKLNEYKNASTILFYASFDGEVETVEMIEEAMKDGKIVGLPRTDRKINEIVPMKIGALEDELEQGSYGIAEPPENSESLDLEKINMVIVPGVAFDKENRRLGRGGGYYDRFLSKISGSIPTVGLAFDFQIVENLPFSAEYDIPVSAVLAG